jgi:hypothetical protein
MIGFKTWVVQTISTDSILQGYLLDQNNNVNVFPVDIDLQPEQFPCIIYQDSAISVLSRPQGMHVGTFQLDIYSLLNALEVEQIYDRVAQLFNFQDSTTQTIDGTLWWIREQNVRDMHDSERKLWRKNIELKFWYSKTDAS